MLLIKFASRGRPEKFFSSIANIKESIGTNNYLILATFDEDDLRYNNPAFINRLKLISQLEYEFIKPSGKIGAINSGINSRLNIPWTWLVNFSDDMRFTINGWYDRMKADISRVTQSDYFAHFNDGFCGDRLSTMTVIDREYYERFFYIYPPGYKSLSCDAEAYFVAKLLGRYHYFDAIYFNHEHPGNSKWFKKDELYQINNKYQDEDADYFHKRMRKYFYVNNPIKENVHFTMPQ
jgi:hypothetical protein